MLRNVPTPSISTSTTSPGLSQTGGLRAMPTPGGVPVKIRSPGSRVKTFDTFAPIGPALVTTDEVGDPHNLGIRLRLNGKTMQDSSTKQLIFGVDVLIAYLSQVVTLQPGDLIFTGTPPGVGSAKKPPVLLKAGDIAEVEIQGIGVLRNPVVAES